MCDSKECAGSLTQPSRLPSNIMTRALNESSQLESNCELNWVNPYSMLLDIELLFIVSFQGIEVVALQFLMVTVYHIPDNTSEVQADS